MKVLVLNAGSSSLKYQLFEMDNESVIAKGNCERIGVDGLITHKVTDGPTVEANVPFPTHKEAFEEILNQLTNGEGKVLSSLDEIKAVGHRVLHGSEIYKTSTLADDEVIDTVMDLRELGPLHNPPQAATMRACRDTFGDTVPMVAVFDTSFHQTMPPKSFIFPIPYEYYEKYSIRRYGFHGTSHRFVSKRYFELTGKNPEGTKIIVCHMGNGSSLCAVKDGKSFDTTMGFTPLDGFIMGTRSGGVDPSVVTYLANKENLSADELSNLLNKKSGFLGVSGVSSDCRDIQSAAASGNERAQLTLDILVHQVKKFIGGYAAEMGGLDAVLFTGGIGENDAVIREAICSDMEFLGLTIDPEKNRAASRNEAVFSTEDSKVTAMVLPTNEEIMIARDTMEVAHLA